MVRGGVGFFYTRIPEGAVFRCAAPRGKARPALRGQSAVILSKRAGYASRRRKTSHAYLPDASPGSDLSLDGRLHDQLRSPARQETCLARLATRGAAARTCFARATSGVPAGAGSAPVGMRCSCSSNPRDVRALTKINATVEREHRPGPGRYSAATAQRSAVQDTDDLYSVPSRLIQSRRGVGRCCRASVIARRLAARSFNLPDEGFAIYPFVTWTSALPFNITTGGDINHDSVFHPISRPSRTPDRPEQLNAIQHIQSHPEAGRGRHPAELRPRPDAIHGRRDRREDVRVLQRTGRLVSAADDPAG